MVMLEQQIQQHFFDAADLKYQSAEALARPVADAAEAIVGCITSGGRLLVFGQGPSQVFARHLVGAMIGRFERERPGLAAVEIGMGATGLPVSVANHLQALGSPGDVLLMLAADADADVATGTALDELVREAHAKEMTVVALVGRSAGALSEAMTETDVLVQVPHERNARVHEMHLLIVHCLCDAVDLQLMGEEHNA